MSLPFHNLFVFALASDFRLSRYLVRHSKLHLKRSRVGEDVESGKREAQVSDGRTSSQTWITRNASLSDPTTRALLEKIALLVGIPKSHDELIQILR